MKATLIFVRVPIAYRFNHARFLEVSRDDTVRWQQILHCGWDDNLFSYPELGAGGIDHHYGEKDGEVDYGGLEELAGERWLRP